MDEITKQERIAKFIDPLGRTWGIFHVPQSALYEIAVAKNMGDGKTTPDRSYVIPASCSSEFTSPEYARREIKAWVTEMWEVSERQEQKNARTQQVAKQLAKDAAEDKKSLVVTQAIELEALKKELITAQRQLVEKAAYDPDVFKYLDDLAPLEPQVKAEDCEAIKKPKPKPKKKTPRKKKVASSSS